MHHFPFFTPFTINIRGHLYEIDRPQVMGIVNVTPDSFYSGSRTFDASAVARRTASLIADGADMIDIGAYSSRPGAADVTPEEETERLRRGIAAVRTVAPDIPLSVDTFRAQVAEAAISEMGADIINDISGGSLDPAMAETAARLHAPYILMHMRGTPATMQSLTDYDDVVNDVTADLAARVQSFRQQGVADIIVDPGFGLFSKTVEQNYALLAATRHISHSTGCPVLVGVSRKSMIRRPLGITPEEALPATTAVHVMALEEGAAILRVHDAGAARQAITLTSMYLSNKSSAPWI